MRELGILVGESLVPHASQWLQACDKASPYCSPPATGIQRGVDSHQIRWSYLAIIDNSHWWACPLWICIAALFKPLKLSACECDHQIFQRVPHDNSWVTWGTLSSPEWALRSLGAPVFPYCTRQEMSSLYPHMYFYKPLSCIPISCLLPEMKSLKPLSLLS